MQDVGSTVHHDAGVEQGNTLSDNNDWTLDE